MLSKPRRNVEVLCNFDFTKAVVLGTKKIIQDYKDDNLLKRSVV